MRLWILPYQGSPRTQWGLLSSTAHCLCICTSAAIFCSLNARSFVFDTYLACDAFRPEEGSSPLQAIRYVQPFHLHRVYTLSSMMLYSF